MITILNGKLTIPESERFIGFAGDNLRRTIEFLVSGAAQADHIYRLYLTFDDGTVNYFTLPSMLTDEGVVLTWQVLTEHIFMSGCVKAQIKAFSHKGVVYHTTTDRFFVGESTEFSDYFKKQNTEFLEYEKKLNDLAESVSDICVLMPFVGDNGNWYIYDADAGEYKDSGKPSVGLVDNLYVKTDMIEDKAVTGDKLADKAITTDKLDTASVTGGKLADNAVNTGHIVDGAVTSEKLAKNSVKGGHIEDGAIGTDQIIDGAVGSAKLATNSISAEKIKDGAVTSDKLADKAVTTDKLDTASVTGGKLADNAVNTGHIMDRAVTEGKIADGSVDYKHLKDGAVAPEKLDREYTRLHQSNGAIRSDSQFLNYLLSGAVSDISESEPFTRLCMFSIGATTGLLNEIGTGRCVGFYISPTKLHMVNMNTNKCFYVNFNEEFLGPVTEITDESKLTVITEMTDLPEIDYSIFNEDRFCGKNVRAVLAYATEIYVFENYYAPDSLFGGIEYQVVKTYKGEEGQGLLDIKERYHYIGSDVWGEWSDNALIGNIDTALDSILAMQESLMGGASE